MKYIKILLISILIFCGGAACHAEEYTWSAVPFGGGGYVTGIISHPSEPQLIYARTDVGGAYRWDDGEWVSLTENFTEKNFYGIAGMTVDPSNADIVYMAVGKSVYQKCDVLKSTDRGETWISCNFPKTFSGNGGKRALGECIAVNPVNSDIIYAGTESDGLWKSSNGGTSWESVNGIPTDCTIRSLVFDGEILYAAAYGDGVYSISGEECAKIENSPAQVRRMAVSSGVLYIAGDKLYRYKDGILSEVFIASNISYISGVDVSGDFVVVSANTGNIMKFPIYYSNDGGETWNNAFKNETHHSSAEWFRNEFFSSSTSCVTIDKADNKKVMFSDWFGIWKTDDITAQCTVWTTPLKGIEESVPFGAVSLPSGARLITALADTDGARYEKFDEYPQRLYAVPKLMSSVSVDFCEENPDFVARVGKNNDNTTGDGGYSADNGVTWNQFADFPRNSDGSKVMGGRIAVSSCVQENGFPVMLMLAIEGDVYRSTDGGASWESIPDFPSGLSQSYWSWKTRLVSDRTDGKRFYAACSSGFYKSDDCGKTWLKTSAMVFSGIKSDYSCADAVWGINSDGALFCSRNGGVTFNKIYGTSGITGFDFGKKRIGSNYSSVYFCGKLNGNYGVYRSDDYGISFEYISGNAKNLYNDASFVTADRQKYGTVYIGTNGSGILKADFAGSSDTGLYEDFEDVTELPDTWEISNVCSIGGLNRQLKLGAWVSGSMSGKAIYKGNKIDNPSYKMQFYADNQGGASGNICVVYFNYHDNSGKISSYKLLLRGGTGGGVQLAKTVNGESTVIAESLSEITNKDSIYTVEYNYGQIKVLHNGKTIIDVTDENPISPGYIGFESVNSVVSIDNISVDVPEAVPVDALIYGEGRKAVKSMDDIKGKQLTAEINISYRQSDAIYKIIYSVKDNEGILRAAGVSDNTEFTAEIPSDIPDGCELWLYTWNESMNPAIEKIRGI